MKRNKLKNTSLIRGNLPEPTKVGRFTWVALDYYGVTNTVLIGIGRTAKRAQKRLESLEEEIGEYGH